MRSRPPSDPTMPLCMLLRCWILTGVSISSRLRPLCRLQKPVSPWPGGTAQEGGVAGMQDAPREPFRPCHTSMHDSAAVNPEEHHDHFPITPPELEFLVLSGAWPGGSAQSRVAGMQDAPREPF